MLAIASLGAAVAFIDATIVNIAFPDIARSFPGTPISTLSWVLNAYNVVFAAFLMAAARIADLLGRRRVFLFGLALFTAGSLLCAIAPSAGALIGFRVVQALGAAFLVPSALALVLNAFPAARRAHAVALLSAVGAAAAGLGPSLGGLLVTAASWRLVFLVNVPIGVAAALLAHRRLVDSRAPGRRRIPDLPGTLLFALAIAALVLGIVKGQEREAVAFSICLPIIAPPQVRGRELLVDGSLVDNLPVQALADMGEGPIIAVDVKGAFERPKNGSAAARAGDDRPPRPPSLAETLTRVLLLGSQNASEAARRHADLVIKPRAEGVGLLEFRQLDTAREAGRVAAREALELAPTGLLTAPTCR